jgi:phage baseplate assembly protein W
MLDASELACELVSGNKPAEAIKRYEARMFVRARSAAQESARNLELSIAMNGAENMAKLMASYLPGC